jgi:hypothetical protein
MRNIITLIILLSLGYLLILGGIFEGNWIIYNNILLNQTISNIEKVTCVINLFFGSLLMCFVFVSFIRKV